MKIYKLHNNTSDLYLVIETENEDICYPISVESPPFILTKNTSKYVLELVSDILCE